MKPIKTYDSNGNLIHFKNSDGFEAWYAVERRIYLDTNGKEVFRIEIHVKEDK